MNKSNIKSLSISRSILLFISIILLFVLGTWTLVTFSFFNGTTSGVVETSSREINKQIILNYESYIFDVIDVGSYIKEVTLEETKVDDYESLIDIYETMDQSNSYITSISLLSLNGIQVITSEGSKHLQSDLFDKEWFKSARNDESIFHFSSPHEEDVYVGGTREVITVAKVVRYVDFGTEREGILVIEIELDDFAKIEEITNLGVNGHIVITDENYKTVFTNKIACQDSTCDSIEFMKEKILGGEFVTESETYMYMNINTISLTRWRIATFVNAEELSESRSTLIISFVIAFIGALGISVLVTSLFSKRLTSPIYILNEYMKEFRKGSLHSKIEITGQKELVELGDSFNQMIEEISELMIEVMQEQRAKRKTQFIALQNQINPHFLYNTLDSILYLNENNRNEDVEEMIVALSKFFRSSISTEKNVIPLREEIEHVKNYLLIQKIRYHNKFKFTFDIDKTLYSFGVIKLGLQPVVENAIYHGIDPESFDNDISIRAFDDKDYVYIEVKNNGYGISKEGIEQIYQGFSDKKASKHIGLKNISQRLKLYYGPKSKVEIESILDEHTIVRIVYPKDRGETL